MRKSKKKDQSIARLLEWQHFKFYGVIFIVGILMLLVIQSITLMGREKTSVNLYSAERLIAEDYRKIDTSGIRANGGSAQLITKDLEVINLEGEGVIREKRLTTESLGQHFAEFGKTQVSASAYKVTFAYEEKGDYWLVVAFPASLEIQISMMASPKSPEFMKELAEITLLVAIYLGLMCMVIYFLSRRASRYFIEPLKKLQDYTEDLEQGAYEKRMTEKLVGEFGSLQNKFYDLAERLHEKTEENKRITEEKSEMLLDLSHDLKNPLTAIQGYAEMLASKEERPFEQKNSYLKAIEQNSHRANDILMSLFQFAQLESGSLMLQKTRVDFCEFIRLRLLESIDELQIAGMEIICHIPDEEYWLEIDEMHMQRVWNNLIGNAMKYNEPGGNIKVDVRKEQDHIILEVADDGIGMTREQAEKVFEPFVRNDEARNSSTGGSGLGLAIVKKIIEAHGGIIQLETEKGKGCHFIIIL